MKKKIFKLTILLAIVFAISGYSYTNNNEDNGKAVTQLAQPSDGSYSDSGCKTCEPYDSCDKCEKCGDPCDSCGCDTCPPEPSEPCCKEVPKTGQPCDCAYNAPARIDTACGMKAWVSASFIYWQPKEKGWDLAKHTTKSLTTNDFSVHVVKQDFDYHPSFKVGAGLNICRDDWTLFLEYTRLNCDDSKSIDLGSVFHVDNDFLETYRFYPITSSSKFKSLKSKWDLDYNMLDLELGRPYYVGKKVVFKPHFGIRGGWLDQRYHLDGSYTNSTSVPYTIINVLQRNKSDSWLIGPRAGLDSDWLIGCDFKVFANLAGSLTYQDYKASLYLEQPVQTGVATATTYTFHNSDNYLTPNVEFATGLGYGRYFCNNEWYFDFVVGYDFHYFWNQNKITNLQDRQQISSAWETDEGSLVLHGLTVTARVDF